MTQFDAMPSESLTGPERTSLLAILALVCALVCFIPGVGLLGVLLAVFALVGIAGSQGRLGGKGIAITALVLGLLVSLVWIGIGVGARSAWSMFEEQIAGGITQKVAAIEVGDYDTARSLFTTSAQDKLTDEAFVAFKDAYTAQLGPMQGPPTGFVEFMKMYGALGESMQEYGGRNDVMPIPMHFQNGDALLLVLIDQSGNAQSPDLSGIVKDLHITPMPDGKPVKLIPDE